MSQASQCGLEITDCQLRLGRSWEETKATQASGNRKTVKLKTFPKQQQLAHSVSDGDNARASSNRCRRV